MLFDAKHDRLITGKRHSESASQVAVYSVSQSFCQPASQSASQSASQPVSQSVS